MQQRPPSLLEHPVAFAHRGGKSHAPENTLAAVQLAWQQHADAVEVDVRISRDGQLVVIHDDNTRRTGKAARKVSDETLAELRSLDVGRWKGRQWSGERIPTLEEVMAAVPLGRRLFVEFKAGPDAIPELSRIARRSGRPPARIVAISFSLEMVKQLKAEMPGLEACWISSFRRYWKPARWSPGAGELIAAAHKAGLDGVDLDARGPINAIFVRKLKRAGLKVYVWTVDSAVKARKLAAAGVDGITTNRPGWLRQKLDELPFLP